VEEKIIEVLSNQDKQSLTITEINDSLNLYDAVSYDDTDLKELENELPIESEEFKL